MGFLFLIASLFWVFFAGLSAVSLFLFVFSVNKFISPGFMLANAAIVVGVLPQLYAVCAAAAAISTRQPIMLLGYLVLWPFQMVRVLSQHSIISGIGSVSQFIAKDKRYENFRTEREDWLRLVSPGHSLSERLLAESDRLMPRMILKWLEAWACAFGVIFVGLFAAGSAGSSPGRLSFGIGNLFAVDPATAVALPGGQRVSFRLKFLSDIRPVAGLSSAAWGKMVEAVRNDFARTGDQVDTWKTVQALEVQPSVTRPEKALRDHSHDLSTGIVALPAQGREAILVGFVDGRWGWVTIDRRTNCAVILGPDLPGCSRHQITDQRAYDMAALDPKQSDGRVYVPVRASSGRSDSYIFEQ